MKKIIGIVFASAVALAAAGCGGATYTEDPQPAPTAGASQYQVITEWRRLPSNNDQVTDLWVRTVKIDGVCFVHTGSVYDYTYTLTPTGKDC